MKFKKQRFQNDKGYHRGYLDGRADAYNCNMRELLMTIYCFPELSKDEIIKLIEYYNKREVDNTWLQNYQ